MAFAHSLPRHAYYSAADVPYGDPPYGDPTYGDAPTVTQPHGYHLVPDPHMPRQDSVHGAFYNPALQPPMACDIKPRLTKEQHDILEAHFAAQSKPNTSTKRGFAESLNVSLDKVNNWFQNRRAKSKQDAKKQANALAMLVVQQPALSSTAASDSSSVAGASDGISPAQHADASQHLHTHRRAPHSTARPPSAGAGSLYDTAPPGVLDMYDGAYDLNRRTLTQEQFDLFAQNGSTAVHPPPSSYVHDGDEILRQVFPEVSEESFTSHRSSFSKPADDPTAESWSSDQSFYHITNGLQQRVLHSTSSSDWTGSRSSSFSLTNEQDFLYPQFPELQRHMSHPQEFLQPLHEEPTVPIASSQAPSGWQHSHMPSMADPVARFLDETSAFANQQDLSLHRVSSTNSQAVVDAEQPFHEALDATRRSSHSSNILTQQLNDIALQTTQATDSGTFKPPPAPSTLAARRQRPRPAALSLRSQSYGAGAQPLSPGQMASPQSGSGSGSSLPLRRIRSSNVIGSVAQGRVTKPGQGAAQRSPINWTFADGLHSPDAILNAASAVNGLQPPTPRSPRDMGGLEQSQSLRSQHGGPWRSASGHFHQQASISEMEGETSAGGMSFAEPAVPVMARQFPANFSSPPHTPMFTRQGQHFYLQADWRNCAITEATPPQSAPATQQSFAAGTFVPLQQPSMQAALCSYNGVSQAPYYPAAPAPDFDDAAFVMSFAPCASAPFAAASQFAVSAVASGPAVDMASTLFANSVPPTSAPGDADLAYPAPFPPLSQQQQHMQLIDHVASTTAGSTPTPVSGADLLPPAHKPVAPPYGPPDRLPPDDYAPTHAPCELLVHEYCPPEPALSAKTPAVPSWPLPDSGPKHFVFANQGPDHFEQKTESQAAAAPAASRNGSLR